MKRICTAGGLAMATVSASVAAALALHCSLMTDFDKPLVIPDSSVTICDDDEDCWSGVRPQDDCDVCDSDSRMCTPEGTDADMDGWWVCERAIGLGTADCDDGEARVFPGNPEIGTPDLLDNDCNGIIDDGRLAASGTAPVLIYKDPTGCSTPCLWSNPVARYEPATDRIAVIWESDESDTGPVENMIRVASFNVSGTSLLSDQYLMYAGAGEEHNLMEPWITGTISPAPSLAAVWIDLLGGRLLGVHGFDMCTDTGDSECILRPLPTWPTTAEEAIVRAVVSDPAEPVIASRSDAAQMAIAWTGVPSGSTAGDVFFARFEHSGSWIHDTSIGTSGIVDVSQSPADDETGRPALAMAGAGLVVAWVSPGQDEIRLVYLAGSGLEPAPSGIVSLSPPGIAGGMRDPVLVASDARPDTALVYLLYCANPAGQSTAEVWAMSVDLDILDTVASDYSDAFGAPLQVSESPGAISIDVAASWTSESSLDAIGVAWNDRRGGLNHVYFRRIAALESSPETSGVLASDEMDLSDDGTAPGVYGQGPTVAGWGSVHEYAVVWWQRRNEVDAETGDLYMRLVEPVD